MESLLREHKKEETAHVLDDDALNDILARRLIFLVKFKVHSIMKGNALSYNGDKK